MTIKKKSSKTIRQINENKIHVDHPIHGDDWTRCSLIYRYLLKCMYTERIRNKQQM